MEEEDKILYYLPFGYNLKIPIKVWEEIIFERTDQEIKIILDDLYEKIYGKKYKKPSIIGRWHLLRMKMALAFSGLSEIPTRKIK